MVVIGHDEVTCFFKLGSCFSFFGKLLSFLFFIHLPRWPSLDTVKSPVSLNLIHVLVFFRNFYLFFFFNVFTIFIIILYNKNKVFIFQFYIFFYFDAFQMTEMYPNFVKKVVRGRSQYYQVEESGKPCADL